MNHSKFEFRNKDLRSRTNKVRQAFQPAPRNLPCWLPSSAEEGRALARDGSPTPAPGWCDWTGWKPSVECCVSQTCIFNTTRSNDDFSVGLQTTPVPLCGTSPPDLRRGARRTPNFQEQVRPAGSPGAPVGLQRLAIFDKNVQRQEAAASSRALEGRQKVAQGKRGKESLAPPWVESSEQFSPLPLNRPPLGDSGGEVGEGGGSLPIGEPYVSLVSECFSARSLIYRNGHGLPPHPGPLPQHKNVPGERENWGTLTQGCPSSSAARAALGYRLTPCWGSIRKKRPAAASQICGLVRTSTAASRRTQPTSVPLAPTRERG